LPEFEHDVFADFPSSIEHVTTDCNHVILASKTIGGQIFDVSAFDTGYGGKATDMDIGTGRLRRGFPQWMIDI
jgi:hypothetical protein